MTIPLHEKLISVKSLLNVDYFLLKKDWLIVENNRSDSIFMCIHLNTGHCNKALGNKGKGAKAYLFPKLVNEQQNSFCILDFEKCEKIDVTLPSFDL